MVQTQTNEGEAGGKSLKQVGNTSDYLVCRQGPGLLMTLRERLTPQEERREVRLKKSVNEKKKSLLINWALSPGREEPMNVAVLEITPKVRGSLLGPGSARKKLSRGHTRA